jgi:hypothetical protein
MYDLSSPMYCHILGVSHSTLYMSCTWAIFQASLLFTCGFLPYYLIGFVPFFHTLKGCLCKLFARVGMPKDIVLFP